MSLLIALALSTAAVAVDYSYSAPTECDPFTVKYSNGEPPFTLQLNVGFSNPLIVNLPDSAWNGKSGSYTMQLNVPAGKEFIITMYDKAGFAKGVNSGVVSVGSSRTNQTCDTTPRTPDFTYGAPDALTQCLTYRFTDFSTAQLPITVNGIIAGGSIFSRTAGPGQSVEFRTDIDIRASTRLIFWVQDSKGRSGGSTEILSVLSSPDTTCIKPDSPSTTQGSTPSQITSSGDGGASIGAIAAAVIGTLIAFVAIGAFIFMRRRRQRSQSSGVIAAPYMTGHSRQSSRFSRRTQSVDLLSANRSGYERTGVTSPSTPSRSFNPHGFPASTSGADTGRAHEGEYDTDPSLTPDPFLGEPTPRTPSSFASQQQQQAGPGAIPSRRSSTSKAAYGPGGRPNMAHPRFILHTDAGAVEEREEDVVELPPMYVDTRSPTSQTAAAASGSSKQRIPPMPPIPDDDRLDADGRPISYNSAVSFPRGARTERTTSIGATSIATGYDDPVLDRSVSQRARSSYASSSQSQSHRAMSSDGSQRPLRAHNPDEEEDERYQGGSSHPQYDFLDDEEYARADGGDDSADDRDVQLAYASSSQDGPQHPLSQRPASRARGESNAVARPSASRQNSAKDR